MRLGLFGGRFDPPHLGHLLLAEQALEQLGLDEVWFVPSKAPPHKPAEAGAEARYEMTLLATGDHPRFRVSRLELDREGVSYAIDTVRETRARVAGELFYLIGADAYAEIHGWHRAAELVREVTMVVLPRPGATLAALAEPYREGLVMLAGRAVEVSSTDLRRRARAGLSLRYLLPPAVAAYLAKHGLYRGG